jgi:hypothetical protein
MNINLKEHYLLSKKTGFKIGDIVKIKNEGQWPFSKRFGFSSEYVVTDIMLKYIKIKSVKDVNSAIKANFKSTYQFRDKHVVSINPGYVEKINC